MSVEYSAAAGESSAKTWRCHSWAFCTSEWESCWVAWLSCRGSFSERRCWAGSIWPTRGGADVVDHLWIFETMSVAILLTAIAVSWWMSLTLIYHDIRLIREGEDLNARITLLREMLVA